MTAQLSWQDPADFFEHAILECDLGDDFLEFPVLASLD
jgi:hypothetical protein